MITQVLQDLEAEENMIKQAKSNTENLDKRIIEVQNLSTRHRHPNLDSSSFRRISREPDHYKSPGCCKGPDGHFNLTLCWNSGLGWGVCRPKKIFFR